MDKTRIAITGATGTALKRTIPALQHSGLCEVTAIQGRNEEKLRAAAGQYGIPHYFLSAEEMLQLVSCELVFIGNPPFMHFESIRTALQYGKAVLCEKPLAANYEEGRRIAELAVENKGIPFGVAHHLRHQKAIADVKNWIQSGEIGRVLNVWCQWGFFMNIDVPKAAWKLNPRKAGAGTFSDNGIHVVDLILHLFGPPQGVFGKSRKIRFGRTCDDESAMLVYDDKTVFLSASQSMKHPGNHLLIYGTEGSIEVFGGMGEGSIERVELKNGNGHQSLTYEKENLYGNEVEDFVSAHFLSREKVPVGASLEEALMSLKIIDLIRESSAREQYQTF
ncbi:MAG: Gfo/Idh/MocA family oxidoreductase [Phaeodactylibacter sp.]|nr:Gfo/Idh/MocA family oxidoreductase [Phaeodactylibacter sp.]